MTTQTDQERAEEVARGMTKTEAKDLLVAVESGGRTSAEIDAGLYRAGAVNFWGWPTPFGHLVAQCLRGHSDVG